jgi:hypothetical protein
MRTLLNVTKMLRNGKKNILTFSVIPWPRPSFRKPEFLEDDFRVISATTYFRQVAPGRAVKIRGELLQIC